MESSLPLAQSGAKPAGFSGPMDDDGKYYPPAFKGYATGGDPFDDEEGPSAYSFSAPGSGPYAQPRRGRWARIKEDYLTVVDWTFGLNALLGRKSKFDGVPREISLNDPEGNRVKGYESNAVATGKYGPVTFLPKFLYGMSFVTRSGPDDGLQPSSPGRQTYSFSSPVSWFQQGLDEVTD